MGEILQVVALYFEFDLVFSFDTFIEQVRWAFGRDTRERERANTKFANKGSTTP